MVGHPLLCITGTTGSGKNSIGVLVAEELSGEVLSLDSMKVYRGMDIGTAKPAREELDRVPHHLIDILGPEDRMDLRRFLGLADDVVEECRVKNCPLVAVGGTAMYLTGLLYGVHDGPSRDDDFRKALRLERDRLGTAPLHARLEAIDPDAAAKIETNDYQRIERALEIFEATGQGPSQLRQDWFSEARFPSLIFVITWPRDVLRTRIENRVDRMFDQGWIEEVRRLRSAGGMSEEASMALGYREILEHLDGKIQEEELRALIKTRTWQFSRRQLTWMKRFESARVIVRSDDDTPETLAAGIAAEFAPIWAAR